MPPHITTDIGRLISAASRMRGDALACRPNAEAGRRLSHRHYAKVPGRRLRDYTLIMRLVLIWLIEGARWPLALFSRADARYFI